MSTYTVPRAQIAQEFTQIPVFGEQPLPAFIFGPNYELHRYAESAEKAGTAVVNPTTPALENYYQSGSDVAYLYPSRTAGTVVDQDYVKVYMDSVEATYFPLTALGTASAVVAKVAIPNTASYYANRLYSSALVFQTANGVNRSAVFSNRDVAVGDVVIVTDGTHPLKSKVTGFVADVTAATTGTAAKGSGNKAVQVVDITNAPVWAGGGSAPTDVSVANSSTAYVGYIEDGVVSDTYTLEVTTGGLVNVVKFKISSTSGSFTTVEDVGVTSSDKIVIDANGGNGVRATISLSNAAVFTAGDKWTIVVDAAVADKKATSAGTYTGAADITYTITVVRGGAFYTGSNATTCARVTVTSSDIDSSGPVNVTEDASFAVGTAGVTALFADAVSNGGLILGDTYTIDCTAAVNADVKTITIQDALTADLLAAGSLTISLYLTQASYEVPEIRSLTGGTVNWSTSATAVTVEAGVLTTNDSLVSGTDPVDLPVVYGKIYVEHRDLLQTYTTAIGSIAALDEVEAKLGTIHPDNPLAQGVYNAALNSAETIVYFCAVATDNLTGYNAVLSLARNSNVVYGMVPLTFDATVRAACVSHVNAMSTPEKAKWRVLWTSLELAPTALIYNLKPAGTAWLGTISDDAVTGIDNSLLTVPGATFDTDGTGKARVGDSVLINFSTAPDGSTIYDTVTVAAVYTNTTLALTEAMATAPSSVKIQVQRNYTEDEQVTNLAAIAGSYLNRRVRVVFPDSVQNGSTVLPGYFVGACLAGLRSGVVPHQGMTNTQILGFDNVSKSVTEFTEDQLNTLAASGVWIVTQNVIGAVPYSRHQLTTDYTSLNTSEDSVTTNVDSISYGMQTVLDPFIGVYNRNTETLTLMRNAIDNELRFRRDGTYTTRAGNQLLGYNIDTLAADPTFKDKVNISITLTVPYPYNYINLTFVV